MALACGAFLGNERRRSSGELCQTVSRDVAVRRGYHRCVRNVSACFMHRQLEQPFCRRFFKPSDGLEPSTPSLPWNLGGNGSQPTATVFACLSRFLCWRICHRLPPVAPAGLHKGSILSCLCWLRTLQEEPAFKELVGTAISERAWRVSGFEALLARKQRCMISISPPFVCLIRRADVGVARCRSRSNHGQRSH